MKEALLSRTKVACAPSGKGRATKYLSKMMNFLTDSLNEPIDGDFLITSGREFHKTGPKQLIDSCFIFKRAGWLLY